MASFRYYLPKIISDNLMYYVGMSQCYIQPYINNTFSASEITSRILIGDLPSASNRDAMQEQGITHIVSVFNGTFELFPKEFNYKLIHINDDAWENIGIFFEESNKFIDEALSKEGTKILIHCKKGVSRSVTIVMAYLLFKINQTTQIPQNNVIESISELLINIKQHRPIADPNPGFIESLKKYIYTLNDYTTPIPQSDNISDKTSDHILHNNM